MYFRDDNGTYMSPGARLAVEARKLRDRARAMTRDAESNLPNRLNPLDDILGRVRNCEQALVALTLYDPEPVRSDGEGATDDRRRRGRDAMGARSWSGKSGSGYEETDGARSDADPGTERDRVQQQLQAQNRYDNGPNRRADGTGDQEMPAAPSPADINRANAALWKRDTESTTGGSQSLEPGSKRAESGGYLPNQAGSINVEGRKSTTAKTLDPGRLFGATTDSMRRGAHIVEAWERRDSAAIASIASKWSARR